MSASTPSDTDGSEDLLLEIVDTLEVYGLDSRSYQLNDFVDVDALEQLLSASDGGVEVRFAVEGVRLSVTADGVRVLDD